MTLFKVDMESGRIQNYVQDVEYCGESLNNLHLTYTIGPWPMGILIVFVLCMNCIVVKVCTVRMWRIEVRAKLANQTLYMYWYHSLFIYLLSLLSFLNNRCQWYVISGSRWRVVTACNWYIRRSREMHTISGWNIIRRWYKVLLS